MAKPVPAFPITWQWLVKRPVCFIGFGFGTGLAPKAPGTFGTLPALFIAGLLLGCGLGKFGLAVLSVILFFIGIWICDVTERSIGVHDYGGIVWDEIAAMMLVLACVPQGLDWWLAAFAAFRFFDAVKPPPIRWFDQKVRGGFGVMLDDFIAALFAIAAVHFLGWLL